MDCEREGGGTSGDQDRDFLDAARSQDLHPTSELLAQSRGGLPGCGTEDQQCRVVCERTTSRRSRHAIELESGKPKGRLHQSRHVSPQVGSLTVIGTGIRPQQLTPESLQPLLEADDLLYLAAEPAGGTWLERLHPNARSLEGCYVEGAARRAAYEAMVEASLEPVRQGRRVCARLLRSSRRLRDAVARGRPTGARGGIPRPDASRVSAEDCLYADLGIDPGLSGRQSYEATKFLEQPPADRRPRLPDPLADQRDRGRPRRLEPAARGLAELAEASARPLPAGARGRALRGLAVSDRGGNRRATPARRRSRRARSRRWRRSSSHRESGDGEPARGDDVPLRLVERAGLDRGGGGLVLRDPRSRSTSASRESASPWRLR